MIERVYIIPLRKEYMKTPKYRRAKKAVRAVREFLIKHMKSDNVLLGPNLNMAIWARGITNPPHHVKVSVVKDDSNEVRAELFGFEFKKKVIKKKVEQQGGLAGKLREKLGVDDMEDEPEQKEEKKAETKPVAGEAKKEQPKQAPKKAPLSKPETKESEVQIKKALEKLDKKTEELKKKKAV